MNKPADFLVITTIALAGCQTMDGNEDIPALISNASAESRAALQQAVNDAMHTEVLIADDALTTTSILIIERRPPRTIQNLPATGRNVDTAVQFRLVMNDSDCILIDTRDGTRHLLENTTCVAE